MLARHGAILLCGYVERSVEVIVLDRLNRRAHERVMQFVKSHFKRGTNYDCEAICQLLERFDTAWARKFRAFVEANDAVKEGLSSVYTVRNSVAHGGDQSLGARRLVDLYVLCKQCVEAVVVSTA
jgi:RiboL-PSP-HEPN